MQASWNEVDLEKAYCQLNPGPTKVASSGDSSMVYIPPVSRVPAEILAIIFTAHVLANNQSPWLPMQVSRSWRAAALMTKRIWARIMLAPSNWTRFQKGVPRVRTLDGMEICFTKHQLILALRRAGGVPLDLKIVYLTKSRRTGKWGAANDLMSLVNCITEYQANPRLYRLNIGLHEYLILPDQIFENFKFADLGSLTLHESYPRLAGKVVSQTQGLRSLLIYASDLENIGQYKTWDTLEELGLRDLVNISSPQKITSVLSATTALTSLSIRDGFLNNNLERIQIRIQSLKELHLRNLRGYWHLDCPNVTHLTLHSPVTFDPVVRLPGLLDISYYATSTYRFYVEESTFRGFEAPSLRRFNFHCQYGVYSKPVLEGIWPIETWHLPGTKPHLSNIEPPTLLFRGSDIDPKVLARLIGGRASLQELFLVAIEVQTSFLDYFVPVWVKKREKRPQETQQGVGGEWRVPCGALKRLTIDFVGCRIMQKRALVEASAKKLTAARITAGVPFERFAIRFSKEEGWKEWPEVG